MNKSSGMQLKAFERSVSIAPRMECFPCQGFASSPQLI